MKTAPLVVILLATSALADDERPLPEEPPTPTPPPAVEDPPQIIPSDAPPSQRLTGAPVFAPAIARNATQVAMAATPHVVAQPPGEPQTRSLGGTGEFGIGFGQWRASHDSITGFAPNFGVGSFVGEHVALSFRVAGVAVADNVYGWIGVMGPHAQLWVSKQAWMGMGFGLALGGACGGGGCGAERTTGVDVRFGFAMKPRGESSANLSVELTTFERITTLSFLLGYQSF